MSALKKLLVFVNLSIKPFFLILLFCCHYRPTPFLEKVVSVRAASISLGLSSCSFQLLLSEDTFLLNEELIILFLYY